MGKARVGPEIAASRARRREGRDADYAWASGDTLGRLLPWRRSPSCARARVGSRVKSINPSVAPVRRQTGGVPFLLLTPPAPQL